MPNLYKIWHEHKQKTLMEKYQITKISDNKFLLKSWVDYLEIYTTNCEFSFNGNLTTYRDSRNSEIIYTLSDEQKFFIKQFKKTLNKNSHV